jgi:hypothetical protein
MCNQPDESLTIAVIATHEKAGNLTVHFWAASGGIPTFEIGSFSRFRLVHLGKWLASRIDRATDVFEGAGSTW